MFSLKNLFVLILWMIYCIVTFMAVLHHEPNHDEANYWLIARDTNFSELFSLIKFSGHPGLWFFLLMPFAKGGMPFFSAAIIHWIFISIAAAAFLFKAPFGLLFKSLFVFSYYMIFQYAVDIRDYNLTIVLVFLIAAIYEKRFEYKLLFAWLIFFLFNSNVHSFGAALALMLIYMADAYRENKLKQLILPVSIMLAGCAALIIQLCPSAAMPVNVLINHHIFPPLNINTAWVILMGTQNAFIPVDTPYDEMKVALLFFLFLLFVLAVFSNRIPVFVFLFISSCWMFYLFSTRVPGGLRHVGLLLVFVIFSLWIVSFYSQRENFFSKAAGRIINFSFAGYAIKLFIGACLLINVIFGFRTLQKEFHYSYTGGEEAGAFIAKNIPSQSEIACYYSYKATAVAPYIPDIKLWFVDRKEYGTYFLLDSVFAKYGNSLSEQEVLERCKEKYRKGKPVLLLLNLPLSEGAATENSARLLFQNKIPVWTGSTEIFWLYRITFPNE